VKFRRFGLLDNIVSKINCQIAVSYVKYHIGDQSYNKHGKFTPMLQILNLACLKKTYKTSLLSIQL